MMYIQVFKGTGDWLADFDVSLLDSCGNGKSDKSDE